jgi:hypothetical protein
VTISHGQALLWGGPSNPNWAFHGITELEESERCKDDPWLQEIQLEIRGGNLSRDNHAFLHGQATSVTGSWTNKKVSCGDNRCQKLSEDRHTNNKWKSKMKSQLILKSILIQMLNISRHV